LAKKERSLLAIFDSFCALGFFDIPEWMLVEQVDDCEQLSIFLSSEKWNIFSLDKDYLELVTKYPRRNIVVHK